MGWELQSDTALTEDAKFNKSTSRAKATLTRQIGCSGKWSRSWVPIPFKPDSVFSQALTSQLLNKALCLQLR